MATRPIDIAYLLFLLLSVHSSPAPRYASPPLLVYTLYKYTRLAVPPAPALITGRVSACDVIFHFKKGNKTRKSETSRIELRRVSTPPPSHSYNQSSLLLLSCLLHRAHVDPFDTANPGKKLRRSDSSSSSNELVAFALFSSPFFFFFFLFFPSPTRLLTLSN